MTLLLKCHLQIWFTQFSGGLDWTLFSPFHVYFKGRKFCSSTEPQNFYAFAEKTFAVGSFESINQSIIRCNSFISFLSFFWRLFFVTVSFLTSIMVDNTHWTHFSCYSIFELSLPLMIIGLSCSKNEINTQVFQRRRYYINVYAN